MPRFFLNECPIHSEVVGKMNVHLRTAVRTLELTQVNWRRALRMLISLSLLAVMIGEAPAKPPRQITSNSQLLLDATLFDTQTGDNVQLIGLIHVQTKVDPTENTMALHANIREEKFLAFVQNDQAPSNPLLDELEALKETVRELKSQIAAITQQITELADELEQVRNTDSNPFLPGTQIDTDKVRELENRIQQLSAELQRLQQELSNVLIRMKDLLKELDESEEQEETIQVYTALGADAVRGSICGLFCERLVDFDLIRANGERTTFQVQLNLQFSRTGHFVGGDALLKQDSDSDDD